MACFGGSTATVDRGASFRFNEESYVPNFTELSDNEKIVLNFDAYYHSEKDTMQIYGVTNSTNGASNKLIYDVLLKAVTLVYRLKSTIGAVQLRLEEDSEIQISLKSADLIRV